MNAQARVFVPLAALNPPPQPRFERTYGEFEAGIESMMYLADNIEDTDNAEDAHEDRVKFRQLSAKLLPMVQYMTTIIQSQYYVGKFEGEDTWLYDALYDMEVLCHRYSWAIMQYIVKLEVYGWGRAHIREYHDNC